MKLIYEIYRTLRKQEIRYIRQQLKHSSFTHEKVGKLFELITQYEERDEAFYSQKLYETEPDNTFRVTKSRLKRILENAILQDKSVSGYSADYVNVLLKSQKRLLQGEILLGRGAYDASKNLLHQVITNTRKYHLHNENLQARLLIYRTYSIRQPVKEFRKQTAEMLELNKMCSLVNEASILHYSISNLLLNRTLETEELQEVHKTIDRIREISEETQHPLAQNHYLLSEIHYHLTYNKFEEALGFCKRYLALIKKEKSQHSLQRLANANIQLAHLSLQLGKLQEAREYAAEPLKIYSKEEMNYLVSLELAFRIAFFSELFDEAQKHIKTALSHPQFEASPTLAARWHYFHACLQFKIGEFRKAYQTLNHTTALLSDKYANFHNRLLEIMIMYENNSLDLMETKILNMRQYVKRSQKSKKMLRPNTLIKILIQWYKQNFDFEQTLEKVQAQLEALSTFEEYNPMKSSGFELIRLEEWMMEKVQ